MSNVALQYLSKTGIHEQNLFLNPELLCIYQERILAVIYRGSSLTKSGPSIFSGGNCMITLFCNAGVL